MKRLFDFILSLILIVLLSPVFLVIALLIMLDSKGGVFFSQERLGKDGVPFRMFKFRTMIPNAEKTGTGLFSYDDDPRVTRIGKYLRMTSLDELPQLINILIGNMSFVGPRPPVTYELGDYADFTLEMKKRFKVRPGITGLAQISGRNELNWDQKIIYDNLYVDDFERHGLIEDLKILWRTVFFVLAMKGIIEKKLESPNV